MTRDPDSDDRSAGQPVPLEARSSRVSVAGPVAPSKRILTLDVLRGVALLGILIVNTAVFFAPLSWMMIADSVWTDGADRVASFAMSWLAHGKFYTLFSMLFGLGMWLQLRRAMERAAAPAPPWEPPGEVGYASVAASGGSGAFVWLYVRRLGVLLAIGLAHGLLLWFGDILATYAVCGVALLVLRFAPDRWLLVIGAGLLLLSLLPTAAFTLLALLTGGMGDAMEAFRQAGESELAAYRSASLGVIQQQRLRDWMLTSTYMLFVTPTVLAMFSLGLVIGRRRLIEDAAKHLRLWRMLALIGLPVGLLFNFGHAMLTSMVELTPTSLVGHVLLTIGAPLLMLGYVACVVLLMQVGTVRRLAAPIAAAGRMALSNYLLQSVVCTTLSYGYGLGLMGHLGPAQWMGVALLLFAIQCPLSMLWLRFFRFGPAEWLWRTLTYGRIQPLLRPAEAV